MRALGGSGGGLELRAAGGCVGSGFDVCSAARRRGCSGFGGAVCSGFPGGTGSGVRRARPAGTRTRTRKRESAACSSLWRLLTRRAGGT